MIKGLYKGYSSYEYERNKNFTINDIELVKLDLLNHIFTIRGTRVMMPTFGTQIPLMVFETLDEITLNILERELRYVFEYDPRVEIIELVVTPNYNTSSVYVLAELLYIELNEINNLELNLEFTN
jgi:phage baseplate assembly protein W